MQGRHVMGTRPETAPNAVGRQASSLDARVESICARGCQQVHADIARLEHGGDLPETQGLGPRERALILAELKAVMAVYGNRCMLDV